MIGIINYGAGNLQSVKNSLDYLRIPNKIINDPSKVKNCDKVILPGVGAFGSAMKKLSDLGFAEKIKAFAGSGKPVLGICLGMQLLMETSEEQGIHSGLGLIKGKVLSFSEKIKKLPIPHMGWNEIYKSKKTLLLKDIEDGSCFYFVHGFYCQPKDKKNIAAYTDYGIKFAAVISSKNVLGCQFHPEKSQAVGLKLLENFNKLL